MKLSTAKLALAAASILLASHCGGKPSAAHSTKERAPVLRPHFTADRSATRLDRDRVQYRGAAFKSGEGFTWTITKPISGRLRFAWSAESAQPVELRISTPCAQQPISIRRSFAQTSSDSVDVAMEDLPINCSSASSIHFDASPATPWFIADLRALVPSNENDAVVMIVVDTLRRDAVGLYGSKRPTTPNSDRIFSKAWRATRAYSDASWTIPSVAALLTSEPAEEHQDDKGNPIGIRKGASTIGNDFLDAGWSTAQFNANPTLNAPMLFDTGFTTFYTPPYDPASMNLPGAHMLDRIDKWVKAHQGERFLLYVQFIDPHEPYGPPDRERGKTPFDPDYSGTFTGQESHHDVSFVKIPTPRDAQHLRALYDDDVRYADQVFGTMWNRFGTPLQNRATVVLTSDHGEEFGEHGGWMHGPSLYDEIVHVPLFIRTRAGHPPLNADADSLVSLLDVGPTIAQLVKVPVRRTVAGDSLIAAKPRAVLPAVTMLTGGPARSAVVRGQGKLYFFDANGTIGVPDPKVDPLGSQLANHLHDLMPPLAHFDLGSDPGEKHPLDARYAEFGADWRATEAAIAHTHRGIDVRFMTASTSPQNVSLAFDAPPAAPFALDGGDSITAPGNTTTISASVAPFDVDGVLLKSDGDSVTAHMLADGPCVIFPGNGGAALRKKGDEVTLKVAASIPRFELDQSGCVTGFAWKATGERPKRTQAEVDEARRKLRSLGYIH